MHVYYCYDCRENFLHPFPVGSPTAPAPGGTDGSAVECFYCGGGVVERLESGVARHLAPPLMHVQSVWATRHGQVPAAPWNVLGRLGPLARSQAGILSPDHPVNRASGPSTLPMPSSAPAQSPSEHTQSFEYNNGHVRISMSTTTTTASPPSNAPGSPVSEAMLRTMQALMPPPLLVQGAPAAVIGGRAGGGLAPFLAAVGMDPSVAGEWTAIVHDPDRYVDLLDRLVQRLFPGQERRQAGLTEEQLLALPQLAPVHHPDDDSLCAICREPYQPKDHPGPAASIRKAPCGHAFHEACLFPWLRRVPSCPMCRQPAIAGDSSHHQ